MPFNWFPPFHLSFPGVASRKRASPCPSVNSKEGKGEAMLDVYEAHGQCHRLSQGKFTDTQDSPWCSNTVPRWANALWGNGIDHVP